MYILLLKLFGVKMVHFIHIGKTGGSAVRNAFEESSILNGRYLLNYPYLFHMHGHEFTLEDCPSGEFVFFTVREPVSRFVSSFYSRKREGRPKNYNPWTEDERTAFAFFATANELGEAIGSAEDKIRKKAIQAMKSIGHVKSSYWDWFKNDSFLISNKSKIFHVLRQERLSDDFDAFKRKYNIDVKSLTNDPIKSHKNVVEFDTKLSSSAIQNISTWYKEDFYFLGLMQELGLVEKDHVNYE
jgi:hypothetical protein